jgi:hypothetical protein
VVLAAAEISITIIAASIPILRALARDKVVRAGPFLALDETDHWTRLRSPRMPVEHDPMPDSLPMGLDSIELQPRTKQQWDSGKKNVHHLSQIQESDEWGLDRRESQIERSFV